MAQAVKAGCGERGVHGLVFRARETDAGIVQLRGGAGHQLQQNGVCRISRIGGDRRSLHPRVEPIGHADGVSPTQGQRIHFHWGQKGKPWIAEVFPEVLARTVEVPVGGKKDGAIGPEGHGELFIPHAGSGIGEPRNGTPVGGNDKELDYKEFSKRMSTVKKLVLFKG